MASASHYLVNLAARGRYHFTTTEAVAALGTSPVAARAALRRLKQKGELAAPLRGFHLIVPPEYRRLGCLPPEQFVPQLMKQLGQRYYVALLSAAELHGAAHHRPQAFQVMLGKNRRPLVCGTVRVQFVARKDLQRTATVHKNTPRGSLVVASAEATALELVGYADQCGGLDNVVSVLAELAEGLDARHLRAAARLAPIAWSQRLGYLLEILERRELSAALAPLVARRARAYAPLVRSLPVAGAQRVEPWKLAVNASVELEGWSPRTTSRTGAKKRRGSRTGRSNKTS
jgi:predicted transcriptional regulator of viral defense system